MSRPRPEIAPLPRARPGGWLSGPRLGVALLAVATLLLGILIARDTILAQGRQTAAPRLATVSRGTVRAVVSGTGSLVPASQVNLNFRVAGQLSEIDVHVGDRVKAGQVLARLDAGTQQASLALAQASLQAAQASLQAAQAPLTPLQLAQLQHNLAAAQQNLDDTSSSVNAQNQADAGAVANDRQQLTNDQNQFNADGCGVSTPANARCSQDQAAINKDQSQLSSDLNRQQLDQVNGQGRVNQARNQVTAAQDNLAVQDQVKPSAVAAAQAQVATAQAQVSSAQLAVSQTTLTAPAEGIIVAINGEAGEAVTAGASTTQEAPGSAAPQPAASSSGGAAAAAGPFMVLSGAGDMLSVIAFAESDAARLTPDQEVALTFDAVPNLTVSGHVLKLAPSATVVSNVVNYYATIVLNRSDPRLKAGMTANATVTVTEVRNVLYVPNAAVRSSGDANMVGVYATGQQIPSEVEVGVVGDSFSEIKAGLNEGQQVVLPTPRLPTGQRPQGGFFGGGGGVRIGGPGGGR